MGYLHKPRDTVDSILKLGLGLRVRLGNNDVVAPTANSRRNCVNDRAWLDVANVVGPLNQYHQGQGNLLAVVRPLCTAIKQVAETDAAHGCPQYEIPQGGNAEPLRGNLADVARGTGPFVGPDRHGSGREAVFDD